MGRTRKVTSISLGPKALYIIERLKKIGTDEGFVFDKSGYVEKLIISDNPDIVEEYENG